VVSKKIRICLLFFFIVQLSFAQSPRSILNFNKGWKFFLGNDSSAISLNYNDAKWRVLDLPHDWSIEGKFSETHPATNQGGALPGGIGWYRKTFTVPVAAKNKIVSIEFDGVYQNSEVWINEHYLGKRPNGYISFQYQLTPHLKFGNEKNVIVVKVDNSAQPNSRWYSGSGIYRNVRLVTKSKISIAQWGTFITTSEVNEREAKINIATTIQSSIEREKSFLLNTNIYDESGKLVSNGIKNSPDSIAFSGDQVGHVYSVKILYPKLWSVDRPYLYKAVTRIMSKGKVIDEYSSTFGVRYFNFDSQKGFTLNGKPLKILGVCNHHDLGAFGAAFNYRAAERQLHILKAMGCNAIRTAHNPPAPELLDLCDKMGFIVMDEAFDMWAKRKNKFDYHLHWKEWHKRDLEDMVRRDRNHPSVFIWSIGNEIREQFDSTGLSITKELVDIVKSVDSTRPVTSALTENIPDKNFIYQSGALNLLGFNYKLDDYPELSKRFPGQKFIAAETSSALATRGHYDMPSDSLRLWPPDSKGPFTRGNPDLTVSAYDHVYAYWGATHEASWNAVKKNDFLAGLFVWSGFDFLGEPVPYPWPARSSYYGVIDLAGFPKDTYYMYQSEWTNKPVLHIFPHWNWKIGDTVDVWAYYNKADEVELLLNGKSLGTRKKIGDALHVMWRVPFKPGTLKAISKKNGKEVLAKEIKTAGAPAKIALVADRKIISADGRDLSFITVKVLDKDGNLVPYADNLIEFTISGEGNIACTDNGYQADLQSFQSKSRKAWKGLALVIVRSSVKKGNIIVQAFSKGLPKAQLIVQSM
jgi:beta-galactosidase